MPFGEDFRVKSGRMKKGFSPTLSSSQFFNVNSMDLVSRSLSNSLAHQCWVLSWSL